MTEFEELPEGCISAILSRTTPVDAARLSVVSKTFHSAADSDAVWNQFLPSDSHFIDSIISHSPSLANIQTKKSLYLALSDRPIIIDNGLKSFQLDRKSGKKCYMLSARSLSIASGDDNRLYWNSIPMHDSRFPEVAELREVWWLDIRGIINMLALSPNTQYAAYLVYKIIGDQGFQNCPVFLSVSVEGGYSSTKIVGLDPNVEDRWPRPSASSDGWLEIKIGKFFNSGLEGEVQMNVKEAIHWKRGLFLEGIEIRPISKTIK